MDNEHYLSLCHDFGWRATFQGSSAFYRGPIKVEVLSEEAKLRGPDGVCEYGNEALQKYEKNVE